MDDKLHKFTAPAESVDSLARPFLLFFQIETFTRTDPFGIIHIHISADARGMGVSEPKCSCKSRNMMVKAYYACFRAVPHIHTDRSAFKKIMNAGYRSHVQFPDQTCELLAQTMKLKQRQSRQHYTISQESSHVWKKRRHHLLKCY